MENSVATSFPIYTTITYKGVVRYVDEYCIWADCRCNYFGGASCFGICVVAEMEA